MKNTNDRNVGKTTLATELSVHEKGFLSHESGVQAKAMAVHRKAFKDHGFDAEFRDFPHYILGITHRIWEERCIETINRYYHPDIKLATNDVVMKDNSSVVGDTVAMLHIFPDRLLLGEDVVWDMQAEGVYFSSHRIVSTMHHRGAGALGVASGRAVVTRAIADCYARGNKIYEEWLVRDWSGVLSQLGEDVKEHAKKNAIDEWKKLVDSVKAAANDTAPVKLPHEQQAEKVVSAGLSLAQEKRAFSKEQPSMALALNDEMAAVIANYVASTKDVWEQSSLAKLGNCFHPAARIEIPGGKIAYGREQLNAFYYTFLGSFSDIVFQCDNLTLTQRENEPLCAALRFHITARHSRDGVFGKPTGGVIHFFSIQHVEFYGREIKNAWMMIDEVSIWKQIYLNHLKIGTDIFAES